MVNPKSLNHSVLLFSFLLLPLFSIPIYAQKIAVKFEKGNWYKVIEKAKEENKLIFVDVMADYCPPCKVMDAEVFPEKSVALFYNEHFISYRIDIEAKESTYLKELFNIKTVPTLLFLTSEGKLIKKLEEGKTAKEFIVLGKEVMSDKRSFMVQVNDNDPDWLRYKELERMYQSGTRQPKFLREYAYLLRRYRKPHNMVVNEYLRTQANRKHLKENRLFVYDFTSNLGNLAVDFFIKDIQHYKQSHGGKKINEKVKTAIYNSILTAIRERDYNLFDKANLIFKDIELPEQDKFVFEMQSLFYQGIEDWENYAEVAYKYLNSKEITDPILLNDIAAKFHQYVNSKKDLKQALKWVKQSIKIENEYYNNTTAASLYHKLGKTKKAIKAAEKAIKIAKLRGRDNYQGALRMVDRMKSQQTKLNLY